MNTKEELLRLHSTIMAKIDIFSLHDSGKACLKNFIFFIENNPKNELLLFRLSRIAEITNIRIETQKDVVFLLDIIYYLTSSQLKILKTKYRFRTKYSEVVFDIEEYLLAKEEGVVIDDENNEYEFDDNKIICTYHLGENGNLLSGLNIKKGGI